MNFKDAEGWLKLGFTARRKCWTKGLYCKWIETDEFGNQFLKMSNPNVPLQPVTKIEKNAKDWERY